MESSSLDTKRVKILPVCAEDTQWRVMELNLGGHTGFLIT